MLWTLVENREHKNSRILQSSIRADPRKSAAKESAPKLPQKFECGSASHRAASFYVVSCLPLSPLRGGTTASARQRSKGVPHLPKPVADHDFKINDLKIKDLKINHPVITNPQPLRWPAALSAPKSKTRGGGRKRPGNQFALSRISGMSPGNSPSRITGCRWLCRNHSASSGTLTFR